MRSEDKRATTGDHCPTDGVWEPIGEPMRGIIIQRGELMPPLNGAAVRWRLVPSPTTVNLSPQKENHD